MFEWEEGDRYSFEDSDRFEEDSLCSWMSEPESVCSNWRGWKKAYNYSNQSYVTILRSSKDGQVLPLVELAAKEVACHIPFEAVEHFYPPVPEQLQLRIAYWSFPENEEDIRLYSCLANGSAEEFQKGEGLLKTKAVKDLLQIGFHLSATVTTASHVGSPKGCFSVAITFDRRRITSCYCTCVSRASWCAHVVAVCLFRIHQPTQVCLRAPVSESLSRLHRDQLQKFAQYLISELPQQILPTAQRLLDDLLSSRQTRINTLSGAPDPTAGASLNEQTTWCLDESQIHENIRKILIKLCVPSPMVFSDVNYLSYTAHPAAAEWSSLLRPLRGREPEGMWNLLSIVREMFRRGDRNAIPLLKILTEEVLACDQIVLWWFNTKVTLHAGGNGHSNRNNLQGNTHASQHACSSLCDEIVVLWRLACLNPGLNSQDRKDFFNELQDWHVKTLERVWKMRTSSTSSNASNINSNINNIANRKADFEVFPGFKPAMEACFLDWNDYPVTGVAYVDGLSKGWYNSNNQSFSAKDTSSTSSHISGAYCCRRPAKPVHSNPIVAEERSDSTSIFSSTVVAAAAANDSPALPAAGAAEMRSAGSENVVESNRSSFSSEGFCESSETEHLDSDTVVNTGSFYSLSRTADSVDASLSIDCEKLKLGSNPSNASGSTSDAVGTASQLDGSDNQNFKLDVNRSSEDAHSTPEQQAAQSESEVPKLDEYNVYRYDTGNNLLSPQISAETIKSGTSHRKLTIPQNAVNLGDDQFVVVVKKMDDPLEILFARAEALHAHGLTKEACQLAVQLAEEILVNPPNLMIDLPTPPIRGKRGRRFNPTCHQISLLASTTLSKAAFLCSVLGEILEHHHLAFRVGLFGLEIARPPASTKALEVKLANQEQELVALLKKIPLNTMQLQTLREKAEQLRDGKLKSRGEALLPLMLASYIFDSLVLSANQQTRSGPPISGRLPSDELLGFEAAVAALGLKANVSEAEHPLLCEGTRRQRGDLAITLLVHYKDDKDKLGRIMDKLLDKEVHQMYKNPTVNACTPPVTSPADTTTAVVGSAKVLESAGATGGTSSKSSSDSNSDEGDTKDQGIEVSVGSGEDVGPSTPYLNGSNEPQRRGVQNERRSSDGDRSEGALSPCWDEDYKAWEARFRCTNLRTAKKHSVGMASIDSSAPETTSSDNSPTVVRRPLWIRPNGPGSDSGSSGESSDSFASSSSGDKMKKCVNSDSVSPQTLSKLVCSATESANTTPVNRSSVSLHVSSSPSSAAVAMNSNQIHVNASVSTPASMAVAATASAQNAAKTTRYKGKRANPSIPNQPSQASSHFMFELAKTVLTKAGGNSSSGVLFTQPTSNQNHRMPHRALHMCAFQIGLYALGLHNAVTPNWLSRTYSSHVSWITGQAAEIGAPAINFLIETWEGHLTPPEVASLADRASRGRDRNMVKTAAKLALSCLPHASALNPNEIQRALMQCREQGNDVLEQACLAIETAAKGGGVYPEVLFEVARNWYQLYEESLPKNSNRNGNQGSSQGSRSENHTPYVQASIGEFQVPTSSSTINSSCYGIIADNPPHLMPGSERPIQNEVILSVNQPAHSSNGVGPFSTITQPSQQIPLQVLPPSHYNISPHPSATIPYRFYSGMPAFPPGHPIPLHPAYIQSPSPFQYQYFSPATTTAAAAAAVAAATLPHLRNPIPGNPIFPTQPMIPNIVMAQGTTVNQSQRLQMIPVTGTTGGQQLMIPVCTGPTVEMQHLHAQYSISHLTNPVQQPLQRLTQRQLGYLLAAYRVGMLAMDILARRVHDDRPQAKYARNPSYGEDVKWLLGIAKKLGTSYLQDFCMCTVNSVASPFILFDIIVEAAAYLTNSNSAAQPFRSPTITPLIQKCQQMFIACTHFKMYHITPADYEEFVSIVRSARQAFQLTPGGMVQFNELLQSLRRSKSYKKELWQHLTNALQQNTNNI